MTEIRLTVVEEAALAAIRDAIETRGYPPTVRELAKALGYSSVSTTHNTLRRLQAKGAIRIDPTKPRAITVVAAEPAHVRLARLEAATRALLDVLDGPGGSAAELDEAIAAAHAALSTEGTTP